MKKLSVFIIAFNSEKKIERVLKSVKWADEIVVADSWSTDKTAEIAAACGARVVQIKFNGFGDLRNNAIKACTHEWILSIDTDELCTDAVAAEIRSTIAGQNPADAYYVPRLNYFMGTWVRHSGWHPNYRQPQLFKNGMMTYDLKVVHEGFVLQPGGRIEHLQNCIWQIPFESISEMLNKANRYSTLGAERVSKNKVSMWQALFHGGWSFIKHFIFKLGFLDGWAGFVIALGNFDGTFYRYVKAMELQKGDEWKFHPAKD
jgi:glycosyltransferase involved in cell wall biosynthesis